MSYTADTLIRGSGTVSAAAILAWFEDRGRIAALQFAPDKTYKPPPSEVGQAIVDVCRETGINWDMVAAQIAHESAYWQSRIVRDKHNPSGLGATNDAPYQNAITFTSPTAGIRATVAHLLSYAMGDANPLRSESRRHEVLRSTGYLGIATRWKDLNGRWAFPGTTYAQSIATAANVLVAFAPPEEAEMSVAAKYGIRGLIDSRSQLVTNANGGPTNRRPLAQKRGAVIHYAGANQPISTVSDMALWQSYARHHIRLNGFGQGFTGSGIMYHIGIGRDGSKHLLNDIEVDRWHCGSWPENGVALAVNFPIGGTQKATAAALKAGREVLDDWIKAGHGTRAEVKGHIEVDNTACPGTLMADLVWPYRKDVTPVADGMFFAETGKFVGHGFWRFYAENGGVRIFGLPLTDEQDMQVNGKTITVQYFERARFEHQPDIAGNPHGVVLGLVGTELLAQAAP